MLAFVSRASLRKPGSHGFYRFFARECMLGLFVLNMRFWNADTNSTHQIISGLLFSVSLFLVFSASRCCNCTANRTPDATMGRCSNLKRLPR